MKRYLCIGFVVALFASSVNADEPVRVAERRATTSRRTAGKSYSFHARKHPVNYYDTRWNPHRPHTLGDGLRPSGREQAEPRQTLPDFRYTS